MIKESVLKIIKEIVGPKNYFNSESHLQSYSYDATPLIKQKPNAVVFPENPEQISKIVKLANHEKFSIVPRGSGTGLSGGSIPVENSIVLVTSHWNKVLEFDESNFTILVEPGLITGYLQNLVESQNLFYPPDPGSSTICTIGGNVAENAGGLRGLKYGVTKNYVIGLEVVLPSGEIIFTGGKSIKDVAGYNLKDYFVGSEGTLGIFTKILLKLIPLPQYKKTILLTFKSLPDAINTANLILQEKISPSMIEFIDKTTIDCINQFSKLNIPNETECIILTEVDGNKYSVEEETKKIIEIASRSNLLSYDISKDKNEELNLKRARKIAFASLARIKPVTILEDVAVPRSELNKILLEIENISKRNNVIIGSFGHVGDGNLHPTILTSMNDKKEMNSAYKAVDEIFNAAIKLGGTITGEHGVGLAKMDYLEKQIKSEQVNLMRKIKSSFDPNNVLNPGKIFSLKPKCEGALPVTGSSIKKLIDEGGWF